MSASTTPASPLQSRPPHPLADPLATAFFGAAEPDPVDFLMLLSEMTQLTPAEYATLWADVVGIGTGVPTSPRERAEYALTAPAKIAEAVTLATRMGEASEKLQLLVMRTLRLTLQAQQRRRMARAGVRPTESTPADGAPEAR